MIPEQIAEVYTSCLDVLMYFYNVKCRFYLILEGHLLIESTSVPGIHRAEFVPQPLSNAPRWDDYCSSSASPHERGHAGLPVNEKPDRN